MSGFRPDSPVFQPFVRTAVACPSFRPFVLLLILPAQRRNLKLARASGSANYSVGFQMPKRKTSFKHTWSAELPFVSKSSKDKFHAFCKLCHIDIDVSSKGKGAVERHAATERHKDNTSSAGHSSLTSFFAPKTTAGDKTTAAELTKLFHTVKHHHSYRSLDCIAKVEKLIFEDSVAKGVTIGRKLHTRICTRIEVGLVWAMVSFFFFVF